MKFLLELFFSFLFFGLFIAFLPTIIGIISLCAIVVFFLSLLKNFFSGDEGTAGETERCEDYVKVNIETEDITAEHVITMTIITMTGAMTICRRRKGTDSGGQGRRFCKSREIAERSGVKTNA